ncbi:MAG: hypothetical protein KKE02_02955 [Alphaproteobacteria bacterium]|nr:hypothetical protein [Alphaproteobacteria bacterium]MBU1513361.1 hypothetical protein [Alphaproteobacteria bacterium]MBU2096353.1 hypothetical protein [Alphaproteobacteria bacterium]MBU2149955.1 hypothetical protein [Alphaproteobacteria bacterium]MBU2309847.1 hypothetical protein [Alphaproteobacteria bacterium]
MRILATGLAIYFLAPSILSASVPEAPVLPLGQICGFAAPEATGGSALTPATAPPKVLAGYGTTGFPISNAPPEAQAFFENGMTLAHAFAHKPAIAAMTEAARLAPDCAMCVWGEAWSRGPTINYSVDKKAAAELAKLADKAATLVKTETPRERALIAALQLRYKKGGNAAFAKAMDDLSRAYPDDNEIAILAADALMITAFWDHGDSNPNVKPAMNRPVELLQAALARNPNDTGAIHFYIHATEVADYPERALPYAERLQSLSPAASHLVHMPSHTYYRVGLYAAAKRSNQDASVIDKANAERQGLEGPGGVWKLTYHGHNVHFAIGAAMMDGDGAAALVQAREVLARPALTPKDGFPQVLAGSAYAAYGRYGEQAQVAGLADPGQTLPFVRAMWRYARGEAAARRGDAGAIRAEAVDLQLTDAQLKPFGEMKPQAKAIVEIARLVLLGRAAMLENDPATASRHFKHAAQLQKTKLHEYSDPPIWWYPIQRSYAVALLEAGQPQRALTEARASLVKFPNDPLTLVVVARAETALGKAGDAVAPLARAKAGWTGDPTILAAHLL